MKQVLLVTRREIASLYASEHWRRLALSYKRRLYTRSIRSLVGSLAEHLDGIVEQTVITRFVDDYAVDRVDLPKIDSSYGGIYFETQCFGLRNTAILRFLAHRGIKLPHIEGELRGNMPCDCCDYEVFLPWKIFCVQCPVCRWYTGLPGEVRMNGMTLAVARERFAADGRIRENWKRFPNSDEVYYRRS